MNISGSGQQVHKKNSKSQNPNQVFKQIKYNNLKTTNIKKISQPLAVKQAVQNKQTSHYHSIGNTEDGSSS